MMPLPRYCCLADDAMPINDEQNLIVLRRDLHYLFDQRRFSFVAKRCSSSAESPSSSTQLVAHVFLPRGSSELVALYQDRSPYAVSGIAVQLLLARFAWALFTDENFPFLKGTQQYAVLLFDLEKGAAVIERLRAPQIAAKASLFDTWSRSRSVSPRKRQLPPVDEAGDCSFREDEDWYHQGDFVDDAQEHWDGD